MLRNAIRSVAQLVIGVVIAALVLQTFLALGWIVPVAVSGSSMAPALLGPHRMYRCAACRSEFAVGLDQLPRGDEAVCPACGRRRATAELGADRPGDRLTIDRTAFDWRRPRRWEVVVFRPPVDARGLAVKRVVGLPGETIALDGGDVFVDGQVVRKSLAEQRSLRQRVDAAEGTVQLQDRHLGDVTIATPPCWRHSSTGELEYHHRGGEPITDETGINQGVAPAAIVVPDIMLTFSARLSGRGRLTLAAGTALVRCEVAADFEPRQITVRINERVVARGRLPTDASRGAGFDEWTLSLFDRQLLLAVGDETLIAVPLETDAPPAAESVPPLAIAAENLSGEIRSLSVWRDVYYAVRPGDVRDSWELSAQNAPWRLGPQEYFVVGDNAAISDDSRSWPSGPGLDAKLLFGKPLGVR